MADPIAAISAGIRPIAPVGEAAGPGALAGSFADTLARALGEVVETQRAADTAARHFATGAATDVAATMIAVERAAVTFQLMLQVRSRLLEAYQEIQRMQV